MPQLPHYLSREGINGIHTSRRAATDHIIAGGSATLGLDVTPPPSEVLMFWNLVMVAMVCLDKLDLLVPIKRMK